MKSLKYIYILITGAIFNVSCSFDDLQLKNPNDLTDETFFKKEEQLQSAVDAIYANLQTRGLYNRHMFFMNDLMSQECTGNPQLEADKSIYPTYSLSADHGPTFMYWDNCYRGINKANFVINNEDKFENVTDASKNRAIGEAKFMRAYYYFLLVNKFGGVPINLGPSEGEPRSTAAQVFDQIISDLTDAAGLLPTKDNTDLGRATQGAAYALLGKAYLYTEQWQPAVDAFENVTGYSLVADHYDNYLEETEYNDESIFEVSFSATFGNADQWGSIGDGINEVSVRGQEYGWNDWFNVYPSDWLLNEFETGDPRYVSTFYSNGETFNNGTMTVAIPLGRTAAWKKYQNYYKQENENMASGINFRVIRYADVLLMQAEAENELGNSAEAIALLNQVRDRVGMPNYGTAAMDATYPVGNQQQIFNAIVHERCVELAGEQVRFNDIVRWGMAATEYAGTGFREGISELIPIPNQEIINNANLTKADQNPGYN
ncbi:RagB/SusD family nutrient uptake outer membrane protein [Reichenbachiella ulvae]|uniref:RagB/SusD family nutrient uptake outer membrane protein n=1 Tax=Reichenbachiella ulvae TaxID=2980104 RepID=A0ABT3CN69_9BACT|nr:RagB/SusD family nutrient uptake outer membrane protein [Reichenbachiella ulvae]MCV9385190.1 RagB/SusD family nutrient uptake outer membrane protein [Reichenbachiella ulvae]